MADLVTFRLNGTELTADRSGVLHWPDRATLVVTDLHLEKGSGFARRGVMLPPYDSRATLERLARSVERLRPERVIALGDSFHDSAAASRLPSADADRIRTLTGTVEWIWVTGNHDPTPPLQWGGVVATELTDGPLTFRHQAETATAPGEVSGHYHPSARLRLKGRGVTGRCFASDGNRLVLPAFGAFTGGLDVHAPDLRRLFARRFEVFLMAADRIWRVPGDRLTRPAPTRPAIA